MTRSRLWAIVLACATLALVACQSDGASGLSTVYGDPLLDMSLGPASNAAFPSITNPRITAAAARDTIEFTARNLPPVGIGNAYQIVLADSATGNAISPTSRIIRTVRSRRPVTRDSSVIVATIDTTIGSQFYVLDTATTIAIRIANTSIPNYTHVLLRSGGEGAVPFLLGAATRTAFLSFRYKSGATYTAEGAVLGSWAPASAARVPFGATATVVDASFWGSSVRIDLRNLSRPPAGFSYAVWLVDDRSGTATRLGGLIAPLPDSRSLDDADVGNAPWYTTATIPEARVRSDMGALGVVPQDFTMLAVVIEPYGGYAPPTHPGTSFVLSAAMPSSVASRSASPGKIVGTVTSTSGKNVANTTVYLRGINMTIPSQVTTAAATGAWQFASVPTGVFRAYAIPVGDVAPRDSATVTVGARTVNGKLAGDSVFVTLRIP
jgi:hypothetical protein